MKKPKIKFNHHYLKLDFLYDLIYDKKTYLIGVSKVHIERLPQDFIRYDTAYRGQKVESGGFYTELYPLPEKGTYLLLVLFTYDNVWTTLRKWTPEKEKKYKALVGQEVEIVIE